ncbi:hypothetical protein Anapl_08950 [Anas platyrhynchos]|uniref:Uncharacterized protein n=1 Tax=Anas platyrhynchos TaxID=8839 RepID=R0LCW3_ANAPL|nr:hypothetical protein Anapl_08950 [Anas platyrhynchos]
MPYLQRCGAVHAQCRIRAGSMQQCRIHPSQPYATSPSRSYSWKALEGRAMFGYLRLHRCGAVTFPQAGSAPMQDVVITFATVNCANLGPCRALAHLHSGSWSFLRLVALHSMHPPGEGLRKYLLSVLQVLPAPRGCVERDAAYPRAEALILPPAACLKHHSPSCSTCCGVPSPCWLVTYLEQRRAAARPQLHHLHAQAWPRNLLFGLFFEAAGAALASQIDLFCVQFSKLVLTAGRAASEGSVCTLTRSTTEALGCSKGAATYSRQKTSNGHSHISLCIAG